MSRWKLREAIAAEAARLILRRKETDYAAARKRAARWLSRRKLRPEDLPSQAEIETQLRALAGLFSEEQQAATLAAMREAALEVMADLRAFAPRLTGAAVAGSVAPGAEVVLTVAAPSADVVLDALRQAGHRSRVVSGETDSVTDPANGRAVVLQVSHRVPLIVRVESPVGQAAVDLNEQEEPRPELNREAVERLVRETPRGTGAPEDSSGPEDAEEGYHPDVFPMLRILLERLAGVKLDPERHPEGDALYHSLQVYQLGLKERPYDEEFLLACLLHDVGLGIDRRNPVAAAVEALRGVLTERTCELIERRREARDALRGGRLTRSLRRSEDCEDLLLLARLDQQGRVPGAAVPTLDEALEHIEGLGSAWDSV